jgi:hypothetical protein
MVTLESVLITVAEKSEQVFCGRKPHLLAGVYFFNPAFEALPRRGWHRVLQGRSLTVVAR